MPGLGHFRLSIIDLSPEGNQPFNATDEHSDIHAIVNGELYNHTSHREQLSQKYNFQSHSDCEVVLALYKHYGLNFLSHLRGEFALVLWDTCLLLRGTGMELSRFIIRLLRGGCLLGRR